MKMFNKFLNLLFPQTCPVCHNRSLDHHIAPICPDCWNLIVPYDGPECNKCGRPLDSEFSSICSQCLKEDPLFKKARSFGLYRGVLKEAIGLFKYSGLIRFSKPLSDIISLIKLPQVDAVLPVPLHISRLREREFNQSALLAKNVANRLGIPLVHNCLLRNRKTVPQVGLGLNDRVKNVRNAFSVQKPGLISGKNILLVDDVFTTGATVQECSGVLKESGAKTVSVITLAHGVRD